MSYDLFVFSGPRPADEGDFGLRLVRFNDGDEAAFDASTRLLAFHDDLLRRFPALEDLPEDKVDDGVWAMTPERSDRLIQVSASWPEAERMAKEVPKLAKRHGLFIFDPQSGHIVRP